MSNTKPAKTTKPTKQTKLNKEPLDVYNRKKFRNMDKKDLNKIIKQKIQKLNRRLASLRESGLADYSYTYKDLEKRLINEYNSLNFSSAHLRNASKEERVEYAVFLSHVETYKMTRKDILEQIKIDRERFKERSGRDLTDEQMRTLYKVMDMWHDYGGSNIIMEIIPSEQIREFFADHIDMTQADLDLFISEIDKFATGERNNLDLPLFLEYYDPQYGGAVKFLPDGSAFDPVDMTLYDEWREHTDETIYDLD